MKRVATLAGILLCLSIGMTAAAQSSPAAQTLFDEGRKLMAAGDYAAACAKLAESQRLDPGAGTLLNLGACYEKRELFASAWVTYTEAAADADRSGRQEWAKKSKERAAALAPILTTLTIVVPPPARVDGLELRRDAQVVGAAEWGVKVPVDGGEHVIEARAPGRATWTTRVQAPARRGALDVTVPPLAIEERPRAEERGTNQTKPEPGSSFGTQRTLGVILGAAGVVGLGIGGAFVLVARSRHDEARPHCTADEALCTRAGLERYDAAGDAANVATAAFITGAVLLAGGVVLYLTAPSRSASAWWRPSTRGWVF